MTSPLQPAFWDAEAQYAWAEFAPLLLRILFNGAQSGAGLLPSGMDVLVDWDVFNQNAINWINEWGSRILNDIVGTTQTQTIKALSDWIRGGEPLDVLEARLGPIVGEARAQMIATTEVTRLYAEGNLMAWKATGLVSAKSWRTAKDDKVCRICGPLDGKVVSLDGGWTMDEEGRVVEGLGITAPPAHARCRCWLQPVVTEEGFREALRKTLNG